MKTLKNHKKEWISKSILIGLVFLIIYNIPFIHNRYTSLGKWDVYSSHYKTHKKIIKKINTKKNILITSFKNNELSKTEFLSSLEKIELQKTEDLKQYSIKLRKLRKEYSYMGYSSFRYFIYAIGLPIFGLFCSILLLVFAFNPNHLRDFRQFYLVAIFGLIYVSSYWLLRAVLTKTDFSQWAYGLSFVALSILAVVLIFLFTYVLSQKESKLKNGIKLLISYISIDLYAKSKNKKKALISDLNKYEELKNIIQ